MNNLELEVVKHTDNGGAHIKLNTGSDNLGFLYLTADQFKAIRGIITSGCLKNDIEFTFKNNLEAEFNSYDDEDIFNIDFYNEDNS